MYQIFFIFILNIITLIISSISFSSRLKLKEFAFVNTIKNTCDPTICKFDSTYCNGQLRGCCDVGGAPEKVPKNRALTDDNTICKCGDDYEGTPASTGEYSCWNNKKMNKLDQNCRDTPCDNDEDCGQYTCGYKNGICSPSPAASAIKKCSCPRNHQGDQCLDFIPDEKTTLDILIQENNKIAREKWINNQTTNQVKGNP